MNKDAMVQMLVSMRAQIDAMLITLHADQPTAPEAPKCPKCGCEKLFPVNAGGRKVTVCNDCGDNF